MAQITWRSVAAPSFRGNAANVAAIRSMGNALNKANIFKTISQDRSDAFDTATQTEQDAFKRESDILTNDRIKQQMGLATSQESRAAEDAKLSNAAAQFGLNTQQERFDSELDRNAAAAAASGSRTNLNTFNLGTAREDAARNARLREGQEALFRTRMSLGNEVLDPKDVSTNMAAVLEQYPDVPELASYATQLENNLTAPTNVEATAIATEEKLRLEARADAEKLAERKNKIAVKKAGKGSKGGDRFTRILKDSPSLSALFSDPTDSDYLEAAAVVNSDMLSGLSEREMIAGLNKYVTEDNIWFPGIDDQDFNRETFLKTINFVE